MKEKLKVALTDFSGDKFLPKFFLLLAMGLSSYTVYVGSTTSVNDAELLGRAIIYMVVAIGFYAGYSSID